MQLTNSPRNVLLSHFFHTLLCPHGSFTVRLLTLSAPFALIIHKAFTVRSPFVQRLLSQSVFFFDYRQVKVKITPEDLQINVNISFTYCSPCVNRSLSAVLHRVHIEHVCCSYIMHITTSATLRPTK